MKLMVLDGNSLVNRAFFGIKLLTTKDGRYTNAIYGFQNILLNLLAAHKPDAVAIAWDERAPTFRHTAYDGYKATRHGMPEELAQQMPVLKELLTDLGFVQVSKAGWEADDILGTLAAACEAAGGTTLLATGDRDSLQLVDDATTVLLATNKETIPMDPAAIREKYGIEPPQLIDVKSLMGDASDNIPGVPGIGEKTALALISKFGSLQGVYDNIDDKAVKPGQRAKLTANRDKADLSYMLGTIRKDAPIETDPAAYLRQPGDPAAAAQLLAALEMHKLVDRWGLNGGTAPAPSENAAPLETVEPSPLPLLLEGRFYAAAHAFNVRFGVSPQGTLSGCRDGQYSDAALWLAKPGYCDYLIPQLYWGLNYRKNGSDALSLGRLAAEWLSLPRTESVQLAFGLGAYRIGDGDEGDTSGPGTEWCTGHALATQATTLRSLGASGAALYRYAFLFANTLYPTLAEQEIAALREVWG